MKITPLASGSQGNCLLLEAAGEVVLVDNGLELEDVTARLRSVDVEPSQVTAICVTHRHKDHIRGVGPFCQEYGVPVFSPRRTLRALSNKLTALCHPVYTDQSFRIGALQVRAVDLSHDAPHTVGYRFTANGVCFGMATDLGRITPDLPQFFDNLDALLLEFNHDPEMLAAGPYHAQLRTRVGGDRGHLSNPQAAMLLRSLNQRRLRAVWMAHVSTRNNTPELAEAAARGALGEDFSGALYLAQQDQPSAACVLHAPDAATSPTTDRQARLEHEH